MLFTVVDSFATKLFRIVFRFNLFLLFEYLIVRRFIASSLSVEEKCLQSDEFLFK